MKKPSKEKQKTKVVKKKEATEYQKNNVKKRKPAKTAKK
jgi:hypothetical protein